MRKGSAILLLMAMHAMAGEQPAGCAWLCGGWTLDQAASESAEQHIDTALEKHDNPAELRQELLTLLVPPPMLTLAEQAEEIVIRIPDRPDRRLTANRTHSRTDQLGTAEIRATWRPDDSLLVTETYDRRRSQTETYALQRDGTLVITREVERPGAKRTRVRAVYRRS